MSSWRDWVNQHATVVIITSVLLMIATLALMFVFKSNAPNVVLPPEDPKSWFYDLGTNELYAADASSVPPIDTPSGRNQGVRAEVMFCGECDEASRKILYLKRWDPTSKQQLLKMKEEMKPDKGGAEMDLEYLAAIMPADFKGHEVRSLKDKQWHLWDSPEGAKIQGGMKAFIDDCKGQGKKVKFCDAK